jgi:hypothetical protein
MASSMVCNGQDPVMMDHVYNTSLKTVILHKQGWELSYPVIEMNTGQQLKLEFDDLSSKLKTFHFKIIHCDRNWKTSQLNSYEYVSEVSDDRIVSYEHSFSTYVPYIHYELQFPNEEVQLKVSGNYVIIIFEQDPGQPSIIKRFSITENAVDVHTILQRSAGEDWYNSTQSLYIRLNANGSPENQPEPGYAVAVVQNGDWNNQVRWCEPFMVSGDEAEFRLENAEAFPGGNEFRSLDLKNIKYLSSAIKGTSYLNNAFHIELHPSAVRTFSNYLTDKDLDGKFLVKLDGSEKSSIDADYVHVYFTLPMDEPTLDGELFIYGALTNWQFDKESQLIYNFRDKSYELTLQLKQGYYNFEYVLVSGHNPVPDLAYIEGNHFETENDYLILVYQRDIAGYDRLTGYSIFNTAIRQ